MLPGALHSICKQMKDFPCGEHLGRATVTTDTKQNCEETRRQMSELRSSFRAVMSNHNTLQINPNQ